MGPKQRDDLIKFYAARFGIPFELSIAQMMAASGGNASAVSAAGARGLFQVRPNTAADLLFDEEVNIMISRYYLRLLYDRTKPFETSCLASVDRWRMALAAQHAGAGVVDRVRCESVKPDSYDAIAEKLPEKTRAYVASIWMRFCQNLNPQE